MPNNKFEKSFQKKKIINSYDRENLPDVMAHVISSRKRLWHLHEDDKLLQNIKKSNSSSINYSGKYFCSIPIIGETVPYGAISFTDYPDKWSTDKDKNFELTLCMDLLLPTLIDAIESQRVSENSKWSDRIIKITEFTRDKGENFSFSPGNFEKEQKIVFQEVITFINKSIDTFGFIAELEQGSKLFNVKGIEGYVDEVHNRIIEGKIYALEDNLQGPIALAVNQDEIIIIPDVLLWRNVLHKFTNNFFKLNNTNSCAAIPIRTSSFSNNLNSYETIIWGAILLEKRTEGPITFDMKIVFEKISLALTEMLSKINKRKELDNKNEILNKFIPSKYANDLIENGSTIVKDYGHLAVIDLKGSTAISLQYPEKIWS